MGCETELKYTLAPSVSAQDVFSHPKLLPYLEEAFSTVTMESTYYDTACGALAERRAALRLRLENGAPIVTLKAEQSVSGALSHRGEWVVGAASVFDALPLLQAAGAPPLVLACLAGENLLVCAKFSFVRRYAILRDGDFSAQLCVDHGYLSRDGARKRPLHELELELLSGEEARLFAFDRLLRQNFSIRPESRSKLARAREE